jgi:DNA-binding transcriptional ArsR family regulator
MPRRPRSGPGAPHLDHSVAEMRALAHPLRLRMMELFAEAPRTTKQVAELLGQPPTRLYHHVAALERAGLLRLRETRKNRGTVEKWYESISRTLGGPLRGSAKRGGPDAADKKAIALTVLEQSRQEVVKAMGRRGGDPPMLARLVMSAPPEMVPKIRARLFAFLKEIQSEYECDASSADAIEERERWAMSLTFAPVWPQRDDDEDDRTR